MDFWEYFGEKPAIYAPDRLAMIEFPMTELFKYCNWLPLPNFFFDRIRDFVREDPKIANARWARPLVEFAQSQFCGAKLYVNELANWSERYHGMKVGVRPKYDHDAQEAYIERRRHAFRTHQRYADSISGGPNQAYFDWRDRRNAAARDAETVLGNFCEYILRHVVRRDDFEITQRHKVLEHMAGELYTRYWKAAIERNTGHAKGAQIICSRKQWREEVASKVPDFLREGAELQRKICRFTDYDFEAIQNFAGDELPQMCAILEASACAKIQTQLNDSLTYLGNFDKSIDMSSQTGAMRDNKIEQSCSILKYRLNITVQDTGDGVIFQQKAANFAGQALETGVTVALSGLVSLINPFAGISMLGSAVSDCGSRIFGSKKQGEKKWEMR